MVIARVALDVPVACLFDYAAPGLTRHDIGKRVLVPFGKKQQVGVVMEIANQSTIPAQRIKSVSHLFQDILPISQRTLDLLKFCSDYYHHPLGQAIIGALPPRLRRNKPVNRKANCWFELTEIGRKLDLSTLPANQVLRRKLLARLKTAGVLALDELREISPSAKKALNELVALGWVQETRRTAAINVASAASAPELNVEQAHVLRPIGMGEFACWLLYGVTGSGKTEVYISLISQVLEQGKQALLLVPEINLSPQLEALLRIRFPQYRVACLHSGLNESERLENWLLAQSGEAQIILGTRLAVFTPIPRLGLIIVDEEHDASFKQQEGLRYSARDVAIYSAKQANVPVILGSATPSLESYQHALSGRYKMAILTQRAVENAALPSLRCIDIRRSKLNEGLSETLIEALRERLQRREQSLIFINRRGYAPVLMCSACAWISGCSRCSSRLVLHLREKKLRCHHCGHEERVPSACPNCGNVDLTPLGQGTQRVESALSELFPSARILRIDRDSTRRKAMWPEMLKNIKEGRTDILVGTQILSKGHDFPKLSLVGILNADSSLYSTDFRASERLFAQLMQVGGRAGRAGIPGEVLIQTQFPDHPLFDALGKHDYSAFAKNLLAERRHAGLPPFVHQALLRAEATRFSTVMNYLAEAAKLVSRINHEVTVYDPVPAYMPRLAGRERGQLLVQSNSRKKLQAFLNDWYPKLAETAGKKVRWALDVDPLEF
ncbi:MAG TPA: primosomal protein N' [Burkholderiales bacterium]|nr:primosomal protein N' [Burkholderiales bacterium]